MHSLFSRCQIERSGGARVVHLGQGGHAAEVLVGTAIVNATAKLIFPDAAVLLALILEFLIDLTYVEIGKNTPDEALAPTGIPAVATLRIRPTPHRAAPSPPQ